MLLTRGFSLKSFAIFWSSFLAALLVAGTLAVSMFGTKAAVTFNKVGPSVPAAKALPPASPVTPTLDPGPADEPDKTSK